MTARLVTVFAFGGLDNISDPASVGVPDASMWVQDQAYTQCVDLKDVDVDNDLNAARREGSTLVTSAGITSSWSNGALAYCVASGLLFTFNGTDLSLMDNSPSLLPVVEFCQVNDIVVFSDGTTIGCIDGGVITVINSSPGGIDPSSIATRVTTDYPARPDLNDTSNLAVDVFEMTTFAGLCLEFYNGTIYLAVGNFVYCTKTFNIAVMDIRRNIVAGFKDTVTMIRAVNDGLFIGTSSETYFLSGTANYLQDDNGASVKGFTQSRVLPFGAAYGSDASIHASKIAALKSANLAAVWLSSDGVYAGSDGGQVVNLTNIKMNMPAASSASAMIRLHGETWQYVACPNLGPFTGGALPGGLLPTVAVNLSNMAHSWYSNYAFNGMFMFGGNYYGTNSLGVFHLVGDTDYVGLLAIQVNASILTPVADFGVKELKRCADACLNVRTAGNMQADVIVDEISVATALPFVAPVQGDNKVRRLRAKLPRGAKGTSWQFRISNVSGARFTAFSLKVEPTVLQRTV